MSTRDSNRASKLRSALYDIRCSLFADEEVGAFLIAHRALDFTGQGLDVVLFDLLGEDVQANGVV
ncbi:hypothetical protein D3C85_1946140 [compost metagenome]